MAHERRVFFPENPHEEQVFEFSIGSTLPLSSSQTHHLLNVLRLPNGSQITVVDARTRSEYLSELLIDPNGPSVRLTSLSNRTSHISPVGILLPALCKGKTNEFIIEKAVELGVEAIHFWQAERSIVRIEEKEEQKKLARFQEIALSAAKQSGQSHLASIKIFRSLNAMLTNLPQEPSSLRLSCSLSECAAPIQSFSPFTPPILLTIGPEGDFTPEEEKKLEEHNFHLISLGTMRLRSETAALVAISMVTALTSQSLEKLS